MPPLRVVVPSVKSDLRVEEYSPANPQDDQSDIFESFGLEAYSKEFVHSKLPSW